MFRKQHLSIGAVIILMDQCCSHELELVSSMVRGLKLLLQVCLKLVPQSYACAELSRVCYLGCRFYYFGGNT